LVGEDLDPRIGCDSQIEPIEETKGLEVSSGETLKLSVGLSNGDQAMVEATQKDNADLFTWFATDLLEVDPQVVIHRLSIFKEARYVSKK